jgi:hypothetical protein
MLMMQNMMNMMMANPAMQEMMASQMQEMMTNSQIVPPPTSVNPTPAPSFTKVPDRAPAVVGPSEYKSSPAPQLMHYQTMNPSPRPESYAHHDTRLSASSRPTDNIVKKIDDMFQDEAEDLDDFYHRYSRSPKASKIVEDSIVDKHSYHPEPAYRPKPETDYHHAKTLGYGQSYHPSRPSRPERYEYRAAPTVMDEVELLHTGKPSVLLQGESEYVPFRDSGEFGHHDSGRKEANHRGPVDDRSFLPRDNHRSGTADFDRPSYDRPGGPRDKEIAKSRFREDDGDRYSRFRGNPRDEEGYETTEPADNSRSLGRNNRRHNNYFMEKEAADVHPEFNSQPTFKEDRPMRRRHDVDRDLDHTPDKYNTRDSDERGLRESHFGGHSQNEDANYHKTKTYVNPHDDIPVGGSKKMNHAYTFQEKNQGSAEKPKKPVVNYDDMPIKAGNKAAFDSHQEIQGSADGGKDSSRGREGPSNRTSPYNENLNKRSVDYDGTGDDDDFTKPSTFSNQTLNEHEAKQIKPPAKDFMQLLEEQLALEGGGSANSSRKYRD